MGLPILLKSTSNRHPKCKGYYVEWAGDYDCGYKTTIECDDCKYGDGRKDPEAKCNTEEKRK